jgi:CRP/FNR family transcriptional regulator, nitrogen oxide reductase regulator
MASSNASEPLSEKIFARELPMPAPISPRVLPLNARISCIQQAQLFRGLTLAQCAEVASIAQERRFSHRQTIFRESDPVRFVLVLVSGRVKLTQLSRFGTEVIFSVGGTGEVLGGLGLAPDSKHRLTAQTLGQCQVLAWDARAFVALEERIPAVRRNAVSILSDRLRILEERFLELATEQVAPRLARMLVRLLEQGNHGSHATRIDLSHEELAQMTGTTLFTVSRLLSEWEQRGVVQTQRKAVMVQDPQRLIDLAESISQR